MCMHIIPARGPQTVLFDFGAVVFSKSHTMFAQSDFVTGVCNDRLGFLTTIDSLAHLPFVSSLCRPNLGYERPAI